MFIHEITISHCLIVCDFSILYFVNLRYCCIQFKYHVDTLSHMSMKDIAKLFSLQLESRDREIVRLTQLLNGGDARSTAALGRDCCFRGVNNLTSDVTTLQQQKLKLQASLQLAVAEQNEAKHRACRLADENRRLEQEAAEMERTMLNVEAEYNKRLTMKENECSKLRQDVGSAGSSASTSKARADRENDVIQNREVLRRTQEEVSSLQTSLRHSKELCTYSSD